MKTKHKYTILIVLFVFVLFCFPLKTYEKFDWLDAGDLLCDISDSDSCSYGVMAAHLTDDEIHAKKIETSINTNNNTNVQQTMKSKSSYQFRTQKQSEHNIPFLNS